MKKRVAGIGGIFLKIERPCGYRLWYKKYLGILSDDYGATFEWRKADAPK